VPINPPPIPSHLPGTIPVTENHVPKKVVINNIIKKKNSLFPTILPGNQPMVSLSRQKFSVKNISTPQKISQQIHIKNSPPWKYIISTPQKISHPPSLPPVTYTNEAPPTLP
jgi:hypothetical protein